MKIFGASSLGLGLLRTETPAEPRPAAPAQLAPARVQLDNPRGALASGLSKKLSPKPLPATSIGPWRALCLAAGLEGGIAGRVPLADLRMLGQIRALKDELTPLSDEALRARFDGLRARAKGGASLLEILPEVLAVIRETSRRVLGKEPYEVQLLAALALSQGKLAQLKTGEGKTLAAGLASAALALSGQGAHVATSNGYLAERDAEELTPLFSALGLSVGVARSWGQTYEEKRAAYAADITYAHADTLAFDWIEDQTWWQRDWRVQRPLHAVIVDEADEVLLDNANFPLVLCGAPEPAERFEARTALLRSANEIARELDQGQFVRLDHERGKVRPYVTEAGLGEVERLVRQHVGLKTGAEVWTPEQGPLLLSILQALEARHSVLSGKDYIRQDGALTLVGSGTGRPNPGARLRHGLMDSVLAKEGKAPEQELLPLGAISYPAFFARYAKLSGMTGTTHGRRDELRELYRLSTVEVPTNRPSQRVDEPDAFFPHPAQRLLAAVADVLETHAAGQPILVTTVSVRASKEVAARLADPLLCLTDVALSSPPLLSAACALLPRGSELRSAAPGDPGLLHAAFRANRAAVEAFAKLLEGAGLPAHALLAHLGGVPHRVLNAETHAEEAAIIGAAGKKGAITVATQMAGRGTDIPLSPEVLELGGLRVIGVERKANLRQDEQVRGRAGRQGQPGSSRFYVSLSDEVFTFLPAHALRALAAKVETSRLDELPSGVVAAYEKALAKAQERGEEENAAARRQGMRLSGALEASRRKMLSWRDEALDATDLARSLTEWIVDDGVQQAQAASFARAQVTELLKRLDYAAPELAAPAQTADELRAQLSSIVERRVEAVIAERKEDGPAFNQFLRGLVLSRLDQMWLDHVMSEEDRQREVYLSSFADGDPVVKHEISSLTIFNQAVERTKADIHAAFASVVRHRAQSLK